MDEDDDKDDFNGPICESWFLAINQTTGWLEFGTVCPHDSCWTIMAWNSDDIGGWFRERAN